MIDVPPSGSRDPMFGSFTKIFSSHMLSVDLVTYFGGRFFLLLILGVCFYFGPFDEVLFNCILGEALS